MVFMTVLRKTRHALVLLAVSALIWSTTGNVASARAVQSPKDQQFVTQVVGGVKNSIAAVDGTRFEVNEFGLYFAASIFADPAFASDMTARAKSTCRKLNAAAKKGPKAVGAAARKIGSEIGQGDREALTQLDADTSLTEDDKFSVGIVIGMVAASVFSNGVRVYCPRHTKHVVTMTQAWTASLSS